MSDLSLNQRSLVLTEEHIPKVFEAATGSKLQNNSFDSKKKELFLRFARKLSCNWSKACRSVGITTQTFYNHRKIDPIFEQMVQEAIQQNIDEMESTSLKVGKTRKGFLDRAMQLKRLKPQEYDRAKVVKIEGYKMTDGERSKRLGAVETVIDAEITKTYLDRKQRQEAKRIEAAGNGQQTGGEKAGGS